jgi:ubiquinol-cytochrome c reductase cytochrome c1 subunit
MKLIKIGLFICLCVSASLSSAEVEELTDIAIPHSPDSLRRGAEVITNICMSCHSLKYIQYGNLAQLGFTDKELGTLRGDKSLKEALITEMSPDMLRDSFGIEPPDLSLMANAREGGPDYIYSLLTGFYQKQDGTVDNKVFPGIKMPDVLNYSDAKEPSQRKPLEQQAKDAAAFLNWAADPHAAERRHIGYFVLGYLVILTILLYLSKRRIWARLH